MKIAAEHLAARLHYRGRGPRDHSPPGSHAAKVREAIAILEGIDPRWWRRALGRAPASAVDEILAEHGFVWELEGDEP